MNPEGDVSGEASASAVSSAEGAHLDSRLLEKRALRVGIMPLVDAAPIIVADRLGFFAEQGLDVTLCRERAWASVRDKLFTGELDASQMLAPMPLATTLGLDAVQFPLVTAMVLSRNGNAITVSSALHARLTVGGTPSTPLAWGRSLRRVLNEDRIAHRPALTLAHVFTFSSHAYQLRYWLAAAGIDPDRDVNLVVVPPPLMVERLTSGRIDGFCVGAPWGAVSLEASVGVPIVNNHEIWPNSAEKVLGVGREWAAAHPNTHIAVVAALLNATRWLGVASNLQTAIRLLAADGVLDVSLQSLRASLPLIRFDGQMSQRPWQSEFMWLGHQMQRWGQLDADVDLAEAADLVCADDVYTAAALLCGIAVPETALRIEGPWFDGVRFDPRRNIVVAPS